MEEEEEEEEKGGGGRDKIKTNVKQQKLNVEMFFLYNWQQNDNFMFCKGR